jgi:chromosome segregation ATPase
VEARERFRGDVERVQAELGQAREQAEQLRGELERVHADAGRTQEALEQAQADAMLAEQLREAKDALAEGLRAELERARERAERLGGELERAREAGTELAERLRSELTEAGLAAERERVGKAAAEARAGAVEEVRAELLARAQRAEARLDAVLIGRARTEDGA